MTTIRAGISALEGDKAAALAGFRTATTALHDLGLPWDQALLALVAAATIGAEDPEVAGWLGEARLTFERLKTAPLIRILDGFAASVWSGRQEDADASSKRGRRASGDTEEQSAEAEAGAEANAG